MLKQPVFINSIASISALGTSMAEIWTNYLHENSLFQKVDANQKHYWVSKFSEESEQFLQDIMTSDSKYKHLDKSVVMAILVARKCFENSHFSDKNIGINFGSSRGATTLFEKHHSDFISDGFVSTFTSPSTTLGNISSWVSHDLQTDGPEISHSITCSTGLHALLNGIAWLQSGMSNQFLVGASEAPLTPFTLSQLSALKVYAKSPNENEPEEMYPNRCLDFEKTLNSMVLGEAASCLSLSLSSENAIAKITGIGYATEVLSSSTSISSDAKCFQKSMKMAIGSNSLEDIDAIVMHAPGTIQGDSTEFEAIKVIFGNNLPMLTSNKWKVGHTFATSGLLSIEFAILMLQKQHFVASPFYKNTNSKNLKKILVNAVGFGGNAVSILVEL
ncbi:beta-ketoacyl synthase N-terminal-like domain-containing protein [Flavobacterium terrigena]|uniref:3-oxoacyl-(Acyl-carrier-protein) synthase n=1 Tax=Flavobacterium terrigena TaxID=402734 RepID=A0A1H6SQH6_9FLAO|nr:beta-ketoacyl synthase N-terminal-like domain-containing protein [Flavobacterium terrigena]SEI69126.1 3-oxoacyl-(acyl-carrier-protein) synthase [Flavobacterium terrigena]